MTCVHLHWREERETVTVRMNSSWMADNTLFSYSIGCFTNIYLKTAGICNHQEDGDDNIEQHDGCN